MASTNETSTTKSTEIEPNISTIIKGVCDENLLNGVCNNVNCTYLHLSEPIILTDAHFHDRLLTPKWSCAIELLANIQQFIGITNVHKPCFWDSTFSILPESLKDRVRLYEAYGIHPRYMEDEPRNNLLRLRDLVQTRPMVAIGECGLDLLSTDQLSLQIEIFTEQIRLANEFRLPLVVHSRKLDQEVLDILKQTTLDNSMKIQWHCCHSKGENVYREFLNYFPSSILSIGGMGCHSSEKHIQRLIKELYQSETDENQRRFVFETDAPYLKPSSLLINSDDNCPILGTLTTSAFITAKLSKSDQWTSMLKTNTHVIRKFFHLT